MPQKHYIVCLVGMSGSGKTTISRLLEDNNIPSVVSYTTRPMRPGEQDGREHHFVSDDRVDHDIMLSPAMRAAYATIGGYRYFATFSQFVSYPLCVYVVDEEGLIMLYDRMREYQMSQSHDEFVICPVYVHADDDVIAARTDAARMARDQSRKKLDQSAYDIIIHNDAPDLDVLSSWCEGFAIGIRALVSCNLMTSDRPVHIYTSDPEMTCIINQLSGVRFHDSKEDVCKSTIT